MLQQPADVQRLSGRGWVGPFAEEQRVGRPPRGFVTCIAAAVVANTGLGMKVGGAAIFFWPRCATKPYFSWKLSGRCDQLRRSEKAQFSCWPAAPTPWWCFRSAAPAGHGYSSISLRMSWRCRLGATGEITHSFAEDFVGQVVRPSRVGLSFQPASIESTL